MPAQRPWQSLAGIAAGPVFVIAFLIEGATRAGYNPLRHPVSSLAIGEWGWTQVINFLVTGSLLAIFGSWLRGHARWPGILVLVAGLGLIGAGCFVTDPLNGYPPGTPDAQTIRTLPGRLHDLFSILFFFGVPIAATSLALRFRRAGSPGWAIGCAVAAIGFVSFFVLAAMGFRQLPGFLDWGGLFQRLSIATGLGWIGALAYGLPNSALPTPPK